MNYLENIREKVSLGNVDLDNIKKQASFFLRDKIKSARLFLTDITASQILTEEATNDEEWGPASKTMAAICDACCRSDEYPRVMQVLHGRLALIGKKHWKQFLKTLTVVEYLLFHGPEQLVMEFSSDRDLIEDLTRFNYVDERMIDRGIVVRKKAKQVLKLLMEDDVLKEERSRALKLSQNILGQGSFQSSSGGIFSSRYGGFGNTSKLSPASEGLMFDTDTEESYIDKKFTAFEERILSEKRGNRQEKTKYASEGSTSSDWRAFEDEVASPSPTQKYSETSWADFSNLSPGRNPGTNGTSTFAGRSGFLEEETSTPPSRQFSTLTSVAYSSVVSPHSPRSSYNAPVDEVKLEARVSTLTPSKSTKKASNYLPVTSSSNFKLPPPPPPPGGSKVTIKPSRFSQSAQPVPDLLDMSLDATSTSAVLSSLSDQVVVSNGSPAKVPESDQDLLGMGSSGSAQAVSDVFDVSNGTALSMSADFASFGDQSHVSTATRSFGDFFYLGSEAPRTSVLDFLGTDVEVPHMSTKFGGSRDQVPLGEAPSVSTNFSAFEDHVSPNKRTGARATGLPEAVPDVVDVIAPDFASFYIRDTQSKPAAKPADDFFNLLS